MLCIKEKFILWFKSMFKEIVKVITHQSRLICLLLVYAHKDRRVYDTENEFV